MFLKSCSVIKLQSSPVKYNQFISFFHFKDISSIFFPKILSARISIPNNLESKAFNSLEASELFTAFLLRVQWNCMVRQKRGSSVRLQHALPLHPSKASCYRNYIIVICLYWLTRPSRPLGTARQVKTSWSLWTFRKGAYTAPRSLCLSSCNFLIFP